MQRSLLLSALMALLGACGADLDLGPALLSAPEGGDAGTADAGRPPEGRGGSASFDAQAPTLAEEAQALGARWEWLTPKPTGETLNAAAGTGMADLWIVGTAGTVLHSDGHTFTSLVASDDVALDTAWSTGPDALLTAGLDLAGKGHLFRVHGASVQEDKAFGGFALQTLAAIDEAHVFVAGAGGEVRAYDGASWRVLRAPAAGYTRGLHAFSATDVWAVGDGGRIDHYDGVSFTKGVWDGTGDDPFDPAFVYEGVWGAAANDVWAVAIHPDRPITTPPGPVTQDAPVFSHFDGTSWHVVTRSAGACGGYATDGNWSSWWHSWGAPVRRPYGRALAGDSATNILYASRAMCPARWDGHAWITEPVLRSAGSTYPSTEGLNGAAVLSDHTLVAGTSRFDPGAPLPTSDGNSLRFAPLLGDAASREQVTSPTFDGAGVLWARTCSSLDLNKTCGPSLWNGASFATYALPHSLFCPWSSAQFPQPNVFTRAADDVWVDGCAGRKDDGNLDRTYGLAHWDGAAWSLVVQPSRDSWASEGAIVGDAEHVWSIHARNADGMAFLHRYGKGGAVDVAQLEPAEARFHLAIDPKSPGRIFAGYTTRLTQLDDGSIPVTVAVDAWDGKSPPRREMERTFTFPTLDAFDNSGHDLFGILRRVGFTPDGRLLAVVDHGIWVRQADGTVTTAIDRPDLEFQDIAPAPAARFWVLASGALFLWDPVTNGFERARHPSPIRELLSAPSGEAWATGSGLLHFPPPNASAR